MLSVQARTKTPVTVSPNYLLGVRTPCAREFFIDKATTIRTFAYRREPCLIFALLPRREFVLSVQARTKTPVTVSPNYLLGVRTPCAREFFIDKATTIRTFAYRREPCLIFALLPRREFVLSVQARTKTPVTVSPNYLLADVPYGTFFIGLFQRCLAYDILCLKTKLE